MRAQCRTRGLPTYSSLEGLGGVSITATSHFLMRSVICCVTVGRGSARGRMFEDVPIWVTLSVVPFSFPGHRLGCEGGCGCVRIGACVRGRARMRVAGMRVMTRRALRDRLVVQEIARELLWKD
jgi:hypothetical protein